jgi:hypothetical protein
VTSGQGISFGCYNKVTTDASQLLVYKNVTYGLRFEPVVCKLKLCKTFALLL